MNVNAKPSPDPLLESSQGGKIVKVKEVLKEAIAPVEGCSICTFSLYMSLPHPLPLPFPKAVFTESSKMYFDSH